MVRMARAGALAMLLAAAGCSRAPAPGEWTGPPPSSDGRIALIRARAAAAERLQASLELIWEDPATARPEGCSAFLVFDRNEGLRVLARSVAFVTVFELVADEERVWLDVPREELTVTGLRDDPAWHRLPASPEAFLIALLADPWAGGAAAGPVQAAPGESSVLRGPDWTLRLDPETGLPASYEKEGLRIEWGDWAPRRGVPWAHEVRIRTAGGLLSARLGRLILNRPGSPGQFEFRPPEGRERLSPAEAYDRWNSALDAP